MAEELDMPPVAAASDPDDVVIVLTDEEGNESYWSIAAYLKIGDRRYVVLAAADDDEDGALLAYRVETDKVDALGDLIDIEDEAEFERVAMAACATLEDMPYCRVCGCTDACACEGGCSWVEPNLCSSCAGKEEKHEHPVDR